MTIYVDVLFVLNFFITYLLLLLTKSLVKFTSKAGRLLFGALIGGVYSLVILAPDLNFFVSLIGKLFESMLIVAASFNIKRLTVFLKTLACFYFSNMLFLGIILALWFWIKPKGIVVNNGIPYFSIPAGTLLLLALAAYVISICIIKIYNYTISKKEIYSLTIVTGEQSIHLFAFLDSGNKLKEPFSDYPVIIVDKSKIDFEPQRIIPYNTVGGEGMLQAFKPDKVIISNGKKSFECDSVYIAAGSVDSKEFSAILNPQLLNI